MTKRNPLGKGLADLAASGDRTAVARAAYSSDYQRYFPGFVLGVTIPDGFVDTSWKFDASPSWTDHKRGLKLWVTYTDRAATIHDGDRFLVEYGSEDDPSTFSSDSWALVLEFIANEGVPADLPPINPETHGDNF